MKPRTRGVDAPRVPYYCRDMKTCGRCKVRKPGVREREIKCHSTYGACWDPRCGTTETVCSACLYGTVTVTTGEPTEGDD